MPGWSCCAAVHAYHFGHLGTSLPRSHSHLDRLPRLQRAEPDTSERGRMEEDISRPIRELDEPVPFVGVEPFDLSPNRQAGWLLELRSGKLQRDVGIDRPMAGAVLFNDHGPSSLTKVSALLRDQFPNRL